MSIKRHPDEPCNGHHAAMPQAIEKIYVSLASDGQATARGGADSPEQAAEIFAQLGAEVTTVVTIEEYEATHARNGPTGDSRI